MLRNLRKKNKRESCDQSAFVSFSFVRISRGQQMEQFLQTTAWTCQYFEERPSLFLPQYPDLSPCRWDVHYGPLPHCISHSQSVHCDFFLIHVAPLNVNRKSPRLRQRLWCFGSKAGFKNSIKGGKKCNTAAAIRPQQASSKEEMKSRDSRNGLFKFKQVQTQKVRTK